MVSLTFGMFSGVAVLLGYGTVGAYGYPCALAIEGGKPYVDDAIHCNGTFPCYVTVSGEFLYSLKCDVHDGLFVCDALCPDKVTVFHPICIGGRWKNNDPSTFCNAATTTSRPRTDDPSMSSSSIRWTSIGLTIVFVVMVCICGMALKASRRRSMQHRNGTSSPTMIYSVTLSCDQGQSLRDTINNYLHQHRAVDEVDVAKPPPYNEVIRDPSIFTQDKPPSYTAVLCNPSLYVPDKQIPSSDIADAEPR